MDCYIATSTNVYKVADLFNASPTVTSLYTFTYAPATDGGRAIAASFGRFFATASDNPWIVVLSYYADAAGHTGTWALYSQDAGATWASEVQITAHYSDVQFRRPGVYASPKTAGLVYAAAFTSTAAGAPSDGYYSTDYGATWSAIANPNIAPDEGMPLCVHVPWPDNAGEKVVYYGSFFVSAGADHYRLQRTGADGATNTDISPSDGSRSYGPSPGLFGVRSYDSDRRYVALAGRGNDVGDFSVAYHGAWVSADYGDTWTNIVSPVLQSALGPEQIAFAENDPNVLYVWGTVGYIGYSQNFGGTVDDRRGNIIATLTTTGQFIGIAGGD